MLGVHWISGEKGRLISVSEITLGRKTKYQLDKVHDTHF